MSEATAVTNEMLEVAVAAHEAGLCVLPPKQDGSKRPLKAWEQYANTSSTLEEVTDWYQSGTRTGLGVVLGAASQNMECLDFDDLDAYEEFHWRMGKAGLGDLRDFIESGRLEKTPNGVHWFYRCSEVAGNTKLARRPKTDEEKSHEHDNVKVLIETRGQGGYAIIAPSHGSVHPSGQSYDLIKGGFDTIKTITPEQRNQVWAIARSMDAMTSAPERKEVAEPVAQGLLTPPTPAPQQGIVGERPGDWYNRTQEWSSILTSAGWTWVFDRGEESYWRRPGKDRDYSGTTNYQGTDVFKVFSSSTPFDPEKSYTKFAAYAVLFHNGDYKAAAKAVFPMMPKENRLLGIVESDRHDSSAPSDHVPSDAGLGGEDAPLAPKPGDSWGWVPLGPVLTGETKNMNLPELLDREDGVPLMYPGRIHEIKGPPEAGKGWLALLACKQEIRKGNNAVYIDFEDYPEGIVERLLAMGLTHEMIDTQFFYTHPEEGFGDEAKALFLANIKQVAPTIAVIDSVAEVMGACSLDPMSNADVQTFIAAMPRPLANAGSAVIMIDHVTKAADNTRYSVGAQHKLAAVSGSSLIVEPESPFGRGMKGVSRISVAKDRPGHVRKHAEGGKLIGRLTVHADDSGTHCDVVLSKPLSMSIEGMEASAELMGEVAAYIESQGQRSPSSREVRENVTGRNEAIDLALDTLLASGYLFREVRAARGGGHAWTSIRPYHG